MRAIGAVALAALLTTACGSDDPPTGAEVPAATTVTVSPTTVDLASLNETSQLTATVLDQNGSTMAAATVSWAAAPGGVVGVADGLTTALTNGVATVTATSGAASGTATVTVDQEAASVVVTPTTMVLFGAGDTATASAAVIDALGSSITGATVDNWTSDDTNTATVDASGLVTAVATGQTTGSADGRAAGVTANGAFTIDVRSLVVGPNELCSDYPPEAVATFTSTHLRSAILDTLGLGPNDDIPCASLAAVDSLQVVAGGFVVNSLAGMQNLTSLEYLWAAGHNIPDLGPLAELRGLTYLNVAGNEIDEIGPVAGLTNLETLLVGENLSLADASPVADLVNLREVSFFNTNVGNTVSALSSATGITTLTISYSEVTDISWIDALADLEVLVANNDTISDLSALSDLTELRTLVLDRNPITDIGMLSGLANLTRLGLDYTGISDITGLSGMTSLVDLELTGNEIADISELTGLTALEELNLAGQVASGTPLLTDIGPLQGLVNLTDLQLHTNGALSNISPLIDNVGIGPGDLVVLTFTNVSCSDVMTLRMSGATVTLPGC